jgi:ABC-type nitrate/sulfonate/bicarbonate transport system ATPase subunit/ABC-type nitrate/sulfonate/bicarbonate transport system permease component
MRQEELRALKVASHKLEVKGLSKSFTLNDAELAALTEVSIYANDGEFVSIIGPSGCGKSTLFNIIAGLIEPSTGEVAIDVVSSSTRACAVGYMPQKDLLLPWRTVLDNAILGLELEGVAKAEARRQALAHMEEFGLAGFENSYPYMLSGGMRQRAAFLRTLLSNKEVLLLDEPFGALDALTRTEMQEWLLRVWETHRKTVLFVTHDVDEAIFLSDRVYLMTARPGRVKLELVVGLPRPRSADMVTSPEHTRLKAQILAALREEGADTTRSVHLVRHDAPSAQKPFKHKAVVPTPSAAPVQPTTSRRATIADYTASLALAFAILALWQLATAIWDIPTWQLPSPWQIATKLVAEWDLLAPHAWVTLKEVLLGFALAFGSGVTLAIAIAYSRLLERAIYPYVIASQTLPIIAIAPMLVVWLGFGIMPKVVVVALISFFPIVVNTVDGLRSVDPDLFNLMRTLGASRWDIFRKAQIPSALPFLFSGTKVAIAVSVIGAIIGEWVGASEGLGYLITRSSAQFQTERLFAAVAVLAAMGIGLFLLVGLLQRLLLPWYRVEEGRR